MFENFSTILITVPELNLQTGWRSVWIALLLALLLGGGLMQAVAQSPAPIAKTSEAASAPSKADIKKSKKLFKQALRLHAEEGKLPEALKALEESTELNPGERAYATTREYVKQELVSKYMERGNRLVEQNRRVEAVAEFREALALDPTNAYADQRLRDSFADAPAQPKARTIDYEYASEPELNPRPGKQNFSFRGDSRQLWQNISRAFGITVTFDDSFSSRPVRFVIDDLDFNTAVRLARKVTEGFVIPISANEMIVAADNQDAHRKLDRMSLRSFYIPTAGSPQDFQEITNVIRTLLDVRFISANPSTAMLTIRAPKQSLDAAAQIIDNLIEGRPQVLLEVRALQMSENMSRQLGVSLPLQFSIFNLDTELRALGPNAQDLINRFRAGTLTPSDLAAAQAALAASQNSPLTKGFATFGGGMTQTGVVIPPASVNFNYSKSTFNTLQHVTLRAEQGHPATFRVGDRFPVLTGTFSSILNIPGIPQSSLQPITPSFAYEDLGITLKTTPQINGNSEVTMQLEMLIRSLGATRVNSIPTITNREYKGVITVRDGETSVLAGSIDVMETKALSGMPWLSRIPGLGKAVSTTDKQASRNEILLLVTPHVLNAKRDKAAKTETYLDGN
ncbi:MAG: repeat protein [Acidobacteriaceae bacterium]|nr:repeat protein [Acidobacteriaceae bacterium]